jgi:hypothetical protein
MFAEMPLDNRTVDKFRGRRRHLWLSFRPLDTSPPSETT